jgi:hypothetical protein
MGMATIVGTICCEVIASVVGGGERIRGGGAGIGERLLRW